MRCVSEYGCDARESNLCIEIETLEYSLNSKQNYLNWFRPPSSSTIRSLNRLCSIAFVLTKFVVDAHQVERDHEKYLPLMIQLLSYSLLELNSTIARYLIDFPVVSILVNLLTIDVNLSTDRKVFVWAGHHLDANGRRQGRGKITLIFSDDGAPTPGIFRPRVRPYTLLCPDRGKLARSFPKSAGRVGRPHRYAIGTNTNQCM